MSVFRAVALVALPTLLRRQSLLFHLHEHIANYLATSTMNQSPESTAEGVSTFTPSSFSSSVGPATLGVGGVNDTKTKPHFGGKPTDEKKGWEIIEVEDAGGPLPVAAASNSLAGGGAKTNMTLDVVARVKATNRRKTSTGNDDESGWEIIEDVKDDTLPVAASPKSKATNKKSTEQKENNGKLWDCFDKKYLSELTL